MPNLAFYILTVVFVELFFSVYIRFVNVLNLGSPIHLPKHFTYIFKTIRIDRNVDSMSGIFFFICIVICIRVRFIVKTLLHFKQFVLWNGIGCLRQANIVALFIGNLISLPSFLRLLIMLFYSMLSKKHTTSLSGPSSPMMSFTSILKKLVKSHDTTSKRWGLVLKNIWSHHITVSLLPVVIL